MNYLTPAAYRHLPPRARCSMGMVYSLIIATAKSTATGQCDRQQESFARWLGCSVKTIKRHEQRLVQLGLLQVVHHQRGNRRSLRVVEMKSRPVVAREWGQMSPHGGDSNVPTVASQATSLLPKKNPSQEETAARAERRPVAGKGTSSQGGSKTAADATVDKVIDPAVAALITRCGIHRHAWEDVRELGRDLARHVGAKEAAAKLEWAGRQTIGATAKTRGARTIGLLRTMVMNLDEKGAPRTGKAVRAGG